MNAKIYYMDRYRKNVEKAKDNEVMARRSEHDIRLLVLKNVELSARLVKAQLRYESNARLDSLKDKIKSNTKLIKELEVVAKKYRRGEYK